MLNQILEVVKTHSQQFVVQNPDIPDNANNAIMNEAANTITGGFQNMLSGGGLQSILSLFTGSSNKQNSNVFSNPLVAMMIGHLSNNLVKKFNLNPAVANGVANNIIPSVINTLVSKTRSNDPVNDHFDLNDFIASFTGGDASQDNRQTNRFDFQGLLDSNGDGRIDLGDIVSTVTGNAQRNQQKGGLGDLIQSFFK